MHRTPRQHNLGTEGWNRTNVEGSKDLRPAIERPRHGTPGRTRTSEPRFTRAMPDSTRPQARRHLEMMVPGQTIAHYDPSSSESCPQPAPHPGTLPAGP